MTIHTMLPRTGFLSNASAELISVLEGLATEVRLSAKEVLFEQDDEGDALFAVIEGRLEISVVSPEGRTLVLDVMRPGALFGEIALFDPGPRTATVTALTPVLLRRLRNSDVLREIERAPHLGIDLLRLAGQRMRWMGQQLGDQVFLPMPTRLARKVLYLTSDSTETAEALNMSQAHLADFVGATREAVSKTLSEWKKAGIILSSRNGITILDRPALKKLAEFGLI